MNHSARGASKDLEANYFEGGCPIIDLIFIM